jgi:hypothetical protein
VLSVTDGINLLSTKRIESRSLKVQVEELELAGEADLPKLLRAEIGGIAATDLDAFCVDPLTRRFEINLAVPRAVPAGRHRLQLSIGRRTFPAVEIELAE